MPNYTNFKDIREKDIFDYRNRLENKDVMYKCRHCKGTGLYDFSFEKKYWSGLFCDKCDGKGMLNFLEIIKLDLNVEDFEIRE